MVKNRSKRSTTSATANPKARRSRPNSTTLLTPAHPGNFVIMRYNSETKAYCASVAAQNAVQNPCLTSGPSLMHHVRRDDDEIDVDENNHVDIALVPMIWNNTGYIAGTPFQEFAVEQHTLGSCTIDIGEPLYFMFQLGQPGSKEHFLSLTTGEDANEFGVAFLQIEDVEVTGGGEPNDPELHVIAFWKRGEYWYFAGGEKNSFAYRVPHLYGQGMLAVLFTEGGHNILCERMSRVFEGRTCTYSSDAGTALFPKIQLRGPENWDEMTEEAFARIPWPAPDLNVNWTKAHSVQIIEDGDVRFIEEMPLPPPPVHLP